MASQSLNLIAISYLGVARILSGGVHLFPEKADDLF